MPGIILTGQAAHQFIHQSPAQQSQQDSFVTARTQNIIFRIQEGGDKALVEIMTELSDPVLDGFCLSAQQIEEAYQSLSSETIALFNRAATNIERFATAVAEQAKPFEQTVDGVITGLRWHPVERVVCYVPSGRYPLPSTALMTTITAKAAGVKEIILASPRLCPEIIAAAKIAGAHKIYQLGGAHAVAAFAFGTQSIPKADMIVGPGNAYVTEAKRQLQGIIGIDMLAGPSEVAIIADDTANSTWVAWDLLAQAEHDPDARAILLTTSMSLAEKTLEAVTTILKDNAELTPHLQHVQHWCKLLVLETVDECIELCNHLAPEHLELMVEAPEAIQSRLEHYGALFVGHETPVPIGDYMSGPNHTLPTARSAHFSGALTPFTFLRPQTFIKVTESNNARLAKDSAQFSDLEGLWAHQHSALERLF